MKLFVGVSLVAVLVMQVEFANLLETFKKADPTYLTTGILFFVLATIFEVLKLYSLLRRSFALFKTIQFVFIGLFINNFLPTNVGGDAYKIYMLNKENSDLGASVLPVFLDRLTGITILILAGLIYTLFKYDELMLRLHDRDVNILMGTDLILILSVLFVIVSVAILIKGKVSSVKRIIEWCAGLVAQASAALKHVTKSDYLFLVLSSTGFHLCRIFGFYYFVLCFNGDIEWYSLILVSALVAVISMLPISIGALGVREGVMVIGLTFFGVELPVAVAVSLIGLMILWSKSLVGAGLFLSTQNNFSKG